MQRAALTVAMAVVLTVAASASSVRIIQTNSAGTTVSVIDPATNKVVGTISGIEVNHGAAAAPDGSTRSACRPPRVRLCWPCMMTSRRCWMLPTP